VNGRVTAGELSLTHGPSILGQEAFTPAILLRYDSSKGIPPCRFPPIAEIFLRHLPLQEPASPWEVRP
jgi:hypothetical protein